MSDLVEPLSGIYNYEQVTDWLGTSGQPTREQFRDIAGAGYHAVINLALSSSDHAVADEGSLVAGEGMAYFHIPVDFEHPTVEDLRLFIGAVKALAGRKVWVHCVVNARVSAFVYQYLRHVEGLDEEASKTELLKKWLPQMDDTWRAFIGLSREEIQID